MAGLEREQKRHVGSARTGYWKLKN